MKKISRLAVGSMLFVLASAADASPVTPETLPCETVLCLGDAPHTSRAAFGRYAVFGSLARSADETIADKYHHGLIDFEYILERGGVGTHEWKTKSHVLSATLVKHTLGEAHGVMDAKVFAPGVGDAIGQFLNVYGGGSWVSSDEGLIAYRTFVGDVSRIAVGSGRYAAGDPHLETSGLTRVAWKSIGEGNLVVFPDRAIAVEISAYDDGTWRYRSPADADFSGKCFAHDDTAFTARDDGKKKVRVHHWLPIDDDGRASFSTGQVGSDTDRDVHVPRQYPTHAGTGLVAPCERIAWVDREADRIGIVGVGNRDWAQGEADWSDAERHPARNGCAPRCTFHVLPVANAQIIGYKAIVRHRLGSPNPDAIAGFSSVCSKSSYDCDAAYDIRSLGDNLDGTRTKWQHGLHSRLGSVGVLAGLETSGDEAFGEIDLTPGLLDRAEAEVFRIRRKGKPRPDLSLRVDLADDVWRVGERPVLLGGTLRDGGVCRWNASAGALDCSGRSTAAREPSDPARAAWEPNDPATAAWEPNDAATAWDPTLRESAVRAPLLRYASRDVSRRSDATPPPPTASRRQQCHHETLFAPSPARSHFLAKRPDAFDVHQIACAIEGEGEIALALEICDGAGTACAAATDPISCSAGAPRTPVVRAPAGAWLRVALGAPTGAVEALTYSICGATR